MPVVALWSPHDLLTSVLTPIGLASTRAPSLVIDLDPYGPRYGSRFTLADLVRDGPTRAQLEPVGRGVSVLANGGVDVSAAADVVGAYLERWPHVVMRCDPRSARPAHAIPILPLLPEPIGIDAHVPAVFQDVGLRVLPPARALVLPKPSAAVIRSLAIMREPTRPSRWLGKLAGLWRLAQ